MAQFHVSAFRVVDQHVGEPVRLERGPGRQPGYQVPTYSFYGTPTAASVAAKAWENLSTASL